MVAIALPVPAREVEGTAAGGRADTRETIRFFELEHRRIRFVTVGATFSTLCAMGWIFAEASASSPYTWITACSLVTFTTTLVLNLTGSFNAARHLLAVGFIAQVTATTAIGYGFSAGTHRWYLLLAIGPFLAFPAARRHWCYVYAGVSVVLMVLMELGITSAQHELPPSIARTVPIASAIHSFSIAAGLFILVVTFVTDLTRAEAENDRLLHNILPRSVARRLKTRPVGIADTFDDVSVLFADIVGFTPLAARLPAGELVALLHRIFARFDAAAGELGLEKVKTIGDAYMVAAGVPDLRYDHAGAAAEMAFRMQAIVDEISAEGLHDIEIRIGIHSGPVVAGVIGTSKFAYDLWGDTVNTAARLESHGQPGAIHISDATRRRLGERYAVEARGPVELKGKGSLETFFLARR